VDLISRRAVIGGVAALSLSGGASKAALIGSRRSLLASGGNSPAVQKFFNRLVTLPTVPRQALYSSLINTLVSGGVFSLGDALWVAGNDAATTLTNLINGTITAAISGAPTFTVDRGFTCNSGVNFISTSFNPSAGGTNYLQDSASVGAWELTSFTPAGETDFIRALASGNTFLFVNTGPVAGAQINSATDTHGTATGSTGWFLGNRSGASSQSISQNNVAISTTAIASAAPANQLFTWFGNAVAQQHAAIWIGASLSLGQQTTLYNAVQTYLHAIGAV
jgi:hypothetical protein